MNRYKISLDKNDFINSHQRIKVSKLSIHDRKYSFETNIETIYYLSDNNIEYVEEFNLFVKIKDVLKQKSFFIVGVFFYLFLLIINSHSINNVHYNIDSVINVEIQNYIDENTRHIGPFSFLKKNIQSINYDLRHKFIDYEWVSIKKVGTNLFVEVRKPLIDDTIPNDSNYPGDLIASRDGIIKYLEVKDGVPIVENNFYVNKGDVLVSGNLLYKLQDEDKVKYIKSEGIVLAETFSTVKIKVIKERSLNEYTGKISEHKRIDLFGLNFDVGKKNKYEDYDKYKREIFNFFGIFRVKSIVYYEKSDIIKVYNEEESKEYSKTVAIDNFLKKKVHDLEKIENIVFLNLVDKEDYYEVTLMVKKLENIAIFQRRSIDE